MKKLNKDAPSPKGDPTFKQRLAEIQKEALAERLADLAEKRAKLAQMHREDALLRAEIEKLRNETAEYRKKIAACEAETAAARAEVSRINALPEMTELQRIKGALSRNERNASMLGDFARQMGISEEAITGALTMEATGETAPSTQQKNNVRITRLI